MSRIGIGMLPELGHLMPTFRLAKNLQERGHDITYIGIPDFEDWIRSLGFAYLSVFEEVFPRGTVARRDESSPEAFVASKAETLAAVAHYLRSDALESRLNDAAFDIILGDTLNDFLLAASRRLGVRTLRLTTSLPQSAEVGVPPLSSGLPFGDTPESVADAARAWDELLAARADASSYHSLKMRLLTERFGYPRDAIDVRGAFEAELPTIPEVVLAPKSLDFPRAPSELRCYAESLWLERPEPEFPWPSSGDERPWVYAAWGTQTHRSSGPRRFQALLRDVAERMPDYQFVLAVRHGDTSATRQPSNLIEVPFAPQMSLLRRADVVMTHGGLGTLKEAFYFGKPVLVFPGAFDQPGNAARVQRHGLGWVASLETAEAVEISSIIRRLHGDARVHGNIARIRSELIELERSRPGTTFVESRIGG